MSTTSRTDPLDTASLTDMLRAKHSRTQRRPHGQTSGQRHPFLFTIIMLTAAAELGLTAFLIGAGNETGSAGYRSLLILLCFESAWTLLFAAAYLLWVMEGGAYVLASVASSVMWLFLTAILWGAAAGIMHNTRAGGYCPGSPPLSKFMPSNTDRGSTRVDRV
ncbi:arabinose efflux permease family transporter, putative [Phanerochaete sordida]|uniref:Arabinose efflux permease family transporter, putative n=1 Tax=Phanerochaete sordida TaxID=48140 RepID=A0A9P3L9U9_9APHY|nr:arabinose efflux permease family transporter, putative [Phanerochaete sordida]